MCTLDDTGVHVYSNVCVHWMIQVCIGNVCTLDDTGVRIGNVCVHWTMQVCV